jgi:putative addiction module killer protein
MIPNKRTVTEYVDSSGNSPFGRWFDRLDMSAATRVSGAIAKVAYGNDGAVKGLGDGVCEIKIGWGPGYRVYFGFDGSTLVILLAGGTKQRQNQDIANAKAHWATYNRNKRKD